MFDIQTKVASFQPVKSEFCPIYANLKLHVDIISFV